MLWTWSRTLGIDLASRPFLWVNSDWERGAYPGFPSKPYVKTPDDQPYVLIVERFTAFGY